MGYPDPQRPGEHPGGQNYPAGPQGPNVPKPTREYERPDAGPVDPGASQGPPAPPPPSPAGPGGPGVPGPQDPPTQQYDGGYQLGYAPGAYGDQYGAPPPQGPPPGPGGPWGPGGDGGDGAGGGNGGNGGNKKLLWIAAAAVVFALVLAVIVALVATSGGPSSSTASETTTTTAPPTTTSGKPGGITLPGEMPSGISIPPIFGGESTGPNARKWRVEVTGSGSAQLVTVGIPETNLFGSQPLPWSKEFTSDSFLVTVTVIGYTGDASCTISRDGTTVAEERSTGGSGGPLICTASR